MPVSISAGMPRLAAQAALVREIAAGLPPKLGARSSGAMAFPLARALPGEVVSGIAPNRLIVHWCTPQPAQSRAGPLSKACCTAKKYKLLTFAIF
jgi:hypothetical protein